MIVEYIRYAIPEDQRGAFEAAYAQARVPLQASPHCLAYECARCAEDPQSYIVRIEWDSLDGHLQGFRRSAEFQVFLGFIRPFIARIAEMQHYEVIS